MSSFPEPSKGWTFEKVIQSLVTRSTVADMGDWVLAAIWLLAIHRRDYDGLFYSISQHAEGLCGPVKPTFLRHLNGALLPIRNLPIKLDPRAPQTIATSEANLVKALEVNNQSLFTNSIKDLLSAYMHAQHLTGPQPVFVEDHYLRVGRHTRIAFVRTLRIPQDGRKYPLPAGISYLPIYRVCDYANRVPSAWLPTGGFFIPLYQREALYLEFGGAEWRPTIAKVSVGSINAVTGKPFDRSIRPHLQDYVVIPNQQWLDGINAEKGAVGQFVAMPLGQGYTVEEQITAEARHGGFQLLCYDSKPGRFPDRDPSERNALKKSYFARHQLSISTPSPENVDRIVRDFLNKIQAEDEKKIAREKYEEKTKMAKALPAAPIPELRLFMAQKRSPSQHILDKIEMGIAAGGSIQQQILVDPLGADTWDQNTVTPIFIHIVNSVAFESITGEKAPPTPITSYSYKKRGLPWYSHYDENTPTVVAAKALRNIKRIFQIDQARGIQAAEPNESIQIDPYQLKQIHIPTVTEHLMRLRADAAEAFSSARYQSVVRLSTSILDLTPDDADALLLRAQAYHQLGQHSLAEMDASSVLDMNPKHVSALMVRALANLSSGWPSLAVQDAQLALQIEPSHINARQLLSEAIQVEQK